MITDNRHEQLLVHLSANDRASVAELSRVLGVTEVTVRKDLEQLQAQGLITRVHGGAVISGRGQLERRLVAREQEHQAEKRRIARATADLIQSGQRIFLDASTTALYVARLIKDRRDLVVVTNGLYIALELSYCEGISTLVLGGSLRPRSNSLVGNLTEEPIRRLRLDLGIFGARGVTGRDGLMEGDLDEAQLKHSLVRASATVVGVVDSSKFGARYLNAFALPDEIHRLITDAQAPEAAVAELRAHGVRVDLV